MGDLSLSPSDFVGWTVTVHENDQLCPVGVFYCVGLWREDTFTDLQLSGHGETRTPNKELALGVNWRALPEQVTRLRQGDFAP